MELREKILEATIEIFNEKSLKFTMDDVAKRLNISKKTIYKEFDNKEGLFYEAAEYTFQAIKESEIAIIKNDSLDIIEKIKKVIVVLPDRYASIDWRQIALMKEKFPDVYHRINARVESDWEPTLNLIQQAIDEKRIKPFPLIIIKTMIQASIESFLSNEEILKSDISYNESLNAMMDIIMGGIEIDDER